MTRSADLATVVDVCRSGGAAWLTGPAGIGKTSLARAAADTLGRPIMWVVGLPCTAGTPLAALIAATPIDVGATALEVMAALQRQLAETNAMMLVETASQVDRASALIIARLLDSGRIPGGCLITDRISPAGPLSASRIRPTVLRVAPLDANQVADVAREELGGPLDPLDVRRLTSASGGNPFFVRQLLGAAIGAGQPVREEHYFALPERLSITDELHAVVSESLRGAPEASIELLKHLSILSPLSYDVIDRLGFTAALADARISHPDLFGCGTRDVYPGQAVFAEVLGSGMGALERRRYVTALIDALAGPDRSAPQMLHRARLACAAAIRLPAEDLLAASGSAFVLGDLRLAEALAVAAEAGGAGPPATMQRARAVAARGRPAEADALLAAIDDTGFGDWELASLAVTIVVNMSTALGDHDRALAALDRFEERIRDVRARWSIRAVRSLVALNAGSMCRALTIARRLTGTPGIDTVWVALAGYVEAEVLRRGGETERPAAVAVEALTAARFAAALVGTGARRTLVQIELARGALGRAREHAEALYDAAMMQDLSRAIARSTTALVQVAAGDLPGAGRSTMEALRALPDSDRSGLGRATATVAAWVCAALGDPDGARRAADRCRRGSAPGTGWDAFNSDLCTAFVAVAQGQVVAPARILRAAAHSALAADQVADAAAALYWAVRLGSRDAAAELVTVARCCEGEILRLQSDHARGLLVGDAGLLVRTSDRFAELGFLPYAADTRSAAILRLRRDMKVVAGDRLIPVLIDLIDRCGGLATPIVRRVLIGASLTDREFEVIAMNRAGCPRRETAAALGLAESSVAGYLAAARAKIG